MESTVTFLLITVFKKKMIAYSISTLTVPQPANLRKKWFFGDVGCDEKPGNFYLMQDHTLFVTLKSPKIRFLHTSAVLLESWKSYQRKYCLGEYKCCRALRSENTAFLTVPPRNIIQKYWKMLVFSL